MADVAGLVQEGADGGGGGEAMAAEWEGHVPDDALMWNKALHGLISSVYGDGRATGVEPEWWSENDNLFVELEEERRGLPRGALEPFLRQPYYDTLVTVEYTTGRTARVEAILYGSGEKLGEWGAFTLFYAKPSDSKQLRSLECGQRVVVGERPHEEQAIVTRILRGTKPAGRAEEARTQHCYYVMLQVSDAIKYVALQHVHYPDPAYGSWTEFVRGGAPFIDWEWLDDVAFEGGRPKVNKLAHFKPKSVSAVAKAAAQYASKGAGKKRKSSQAVPASAKRSAHKVATSDPSDDGESGDDSGS